MKSMKPCKQMRPALALWIGHDLDEAEEKQVRRHVAECGGCRDYSQQLQGSQHVLEQTGAVTAALEVTDDSLWPEVRGTLLQRARRSSVRPSAGRIQRLLPIGALTAACLTIWFSSQNDLPLHWPEKVSNFRGTLVEPMMNHAPQWPGFDNLPRTLERIELPKEFPLNGKTSLPKSLPSVSYPLDVPGRLDADGYGP